jgi:ribosomal protein L11 methyltransferase
VEYKALYFKLDNISATLKEIIIAELDYIGFEGFLETEEGVVAYIPQKNFKKINFKNTEFYKNPLFKKLTIKEEFILEKNWNEFWEISYEPVIIKNECLIRAPFHKNLPGYKYELIIEPKMSFGTGHHETTALMIEDILEMDVNNKTVLDVGCGTGILSILSAQKGSSRVTAMDISDYAFKNTIENIHRNNIKNITVIKGYIDLIKNKKFNIILANLQLNILLNDIKCYTPLLEAGGLLVMSGIYTKDIPEIKKECFKYSLKYVSFKEKNNWVSIKFTAT